MWPPPLLVQRSPVVQVILAVVLPAATGLVCGVLLSVSGAAYTVVTLVVILGGISNGYEHADLLEGAGRGLAGGMLFGTFILFGHVVAGGHAQASLPHPHVVLPIATTIIGALLGMSGGALRSRRERRAGSPADAA